jgi:hypothetical protein
MRRALLLAALLLPFPVALAIADDAPKTQSPPAAKAADAAQIDRWIQRLGDEDFRVREEASKQLQTIGEPARAALEKAMKGSESLEVRWRAEQLLRRLDRQGEQSLDAKDSGEPGGVTPTPGREQTMPSTNRDLDRLRKLLEERFGGAFGQQFGQELRKQIEDAFRDSPFGMLGMGLGARHVEVPGLALDVSPDGKATLRVRAEDANGGAGEKTYEGKDLADILAKNPELKDHAGMADLQRRAKDLQTDAMPGFHFGGMIGVQPGTTVFSTSSGVEITQEPGKVKVTIRKKDDQGKDVAQTFEGTDLEQLKNDHPEVRKALEGFSISFGPSFHAPKIFGDRPFDGLAPEEEPEDGSAAPTETEGPYFGIKAGPLGETLAYQLGLQKEAGVLIHDVKPGSPAAEIGLRRYDVVVSIDGKPVTDYDAAIATLHAAAKNKGPLTLEVIRETKRTTLSR